MSAHPHSVLIIWLCEGEVRDSLEWYQRIILKIKCTRSVSEICTFFGRDIGPRKRCVQTLC